MSTDRVVEIVEAVLYEGYLLWPYRRSALKNQQRWTFGGVYPERWSTTGGQADPWRTQTEVLVEGGPATTLDVTLRFLHVVDRRVARLTSSGLAPVDGLDVDGTSYLSWEEATEREVRMPSAALGALQTAPARVTIDIPAGRHEETLRDAHGTQRGAVIRRWEPLCGTVETTTTRVREGLWRVRVVTANTTPFDGADRRDALRSTFVATHAVLATDAAFVSLTDPPDACRAAADACRNIGTWPVLVGEDGERRLMLSSPIILYDYPRIAPESPQNLFDATEIDQLLVLNVLSLTEDERREVRASDARGRALLERCVSLSSEELTRLHGVMRDVRPVEAGPIDAPKAEP